MDISPCPCMVTLSDGKNHTLFKFRDFLELVDEKMGMEARRWLEERVGGLEEAADYTAQSVESDLTNYEASLDSNRDAFEEIQTQAAAIMEVLQGTRINRQKIAHAVREIGKIIDNQL